MAPCACRQTRYAGAASPRPIWKKTRASSSGAAAEAPRGGALPFPAGLGARRERRGAPGELRRRSPARRAPRPCAAPRCASRVDVESLLTETVSQLTDEDVVEGAAFLHEWVQGEATKSPESRRDAAFGATIERLAASCSLNFPPRLPQARLALGLLLSRKFPSGARAAVWRVCGLAGTAAHLRVDVDAVRLLRRGRGLLVDDVLLCLKHDPPADAPCVLLAKQRLAAFPGAAPEGPSRARAGAGLLRERGSAAQFAELPGAEQPARTERAEEFYLPRDRSDPSRRTSPLRARALL